MHKRKNKCKKINNLRKPNFEIDSDKLSEIIAEAIVKAEEKKNTDIEKKIYNKLSVWKKFKCFLFNEDPDDQEILVDFFKTPIVLLFRIISIMCLVLFPVVCTLVIEGFQTLPLICVAWYDWTTYISLYILAPIFILGLMISSWAVANQFSREKDKHFVLTLFSGVISSIALIVSIIALLKGVG